MALSNYLTHSIVCTTLFYGYGFGLFGHNQPHRAGRDRAHDLDHPASHQPDLAQHFRFGPAEWLWRSLTYWRLQPMRVWPCKNWPP